MADLLTRVRAVKGFEDTDRKGAILFEGARKIKKLIEAGASATDILEVYHHAVVAYSTAHLLGFASVAEGMRPQLISLAEAEADKHEKTFVEVLEKK